jgi:1-acyl-sn-glycerol-3-phosphate acyltransferase
MDSLTAFARAIVAWPVLAFNVFIHGTLIIFLALFKLLLPFQFVRKPLDLLLNAIAQNWVRCNNLWTQALLPIEWQLDGLEQLDPRGWYLIASNHQSWVDIFVLQKAMHGRTPFLKFFIKQELIYVPVVGMACWAMDFPFMRRYSRAYLEKHPDRAGQDQATTRKSCARFSLVPTAVINFLEGTRCTPAKQARQQSPYRHLLKPKAGGMALAMQAMGEKFNALLDVTIFYPDGIPTMTDFMTGRLRRVVVQVRKLAIPGEFTVSNPAPGVRSQVQDWLNTLWQGKDRQLDRLALAYQAPAPADGKDAPAGAANEEDGAGQHRRYR